jgi:hypothetical protein
MRRLAVFFALLALACGSDSSTTPGGTIAGTWSLKTINGTSLPFIVAQTGADKLEIVSDVYVISGTGSFTETTTLRATTNGVATTQSVADAGSYTLNGTAITVRYNSDGSSVTGSWSGNTITVTQDGLAAVYTR